MLRIYSTVILVALFIDSVSCTQDLYKVFNGYRYNQHVFTRKTTKSKFACATYCSSHPSCVSFDFASAGGGFVTCEFSTTGTYDLLGLEQNPNFTYVLIKRDPEGCGALLCANGSRSVQLSVSSEHRGGMWDYYGADRSCLDTLPSDGAAGSWTSYTRDNEWIEADLLIIHRIVSIVTQGRPDMDQWVTTYKIEYSADALSWDTVRHLDGVVQEFQGNFDSNTQVIQRTDFVARYVKLFVIDYHIAISLRWELIGCDML